MLNPHRRWTIQLKLQSAWNKVGKFRASKALSSSYLTNGLSLVENDERELQNSNAVERSRKLPRYPRHRVTVIYVIRNFNERKLTLSPRVRSGGRTRLRATPFFVFDATLSFLPGFFSSPPQKKKKKKKKKEENEKERVFNRSKLYSHSGSISENMECKCSRTST